MKISQNFVAFSEYMNLILAVLDILEFVNFFNFITYWPYSPGQGYFLSPQIAYRMTQNIWYYVEYCFTSFYR